MWEGIRLCPLEHSCSPSKGFCLGSPRGAEVMIPFQDHKEPRWAAFPLSMRSWLLTVIAMVSLQNINLNNHARQPDKSQDLSVPLFKWNVSQPLIFPRFVLSCWSQIYWEYDISQLIWRLKLWRQFRLSLWYPVSRLHLLKDKVN